VVLSIWNVRASQAVECGLGRGLCQPVEAGAIQHFHSGPFGGHQRECIHARGRE
jgi:hypothetical protein